MKYPERKLAVIIPAAGSGKRMGQAVPKPLIRLDGMTILERTLRRFSELPLHEMIVVISEAIRKETERICSRLETSFPLRLAGGGKERQDSVWNALGALDRESDIVAVHDAARPFFDPGFFRRAFSLLETHDGVVAGFPAAYTMKKVSGMLIQETLPEKHSGRRIRRRSFTGRSSKTPTVTPWKTDFTGRTMPCWSNAWAGRLQ
ncbi:MAG: 2-C-methyl-D-erythritol 4-phosphate cytidylyltransferase [Candidatus Marinimicrobia bacterium]|nr:2-C-methyl-D-erythritol 4-phosphate cytidylyltransferase [Candidatus Neomarinimicrobiota bacterium]